MVRHVYFDKIKAVGHTHASGHWIDSNPNIVGLGPFGLQSQLKINDSSALLSH